MRYSLYPWLAASLLALSACRHDADALGADPAPMPTPGPALYRVTFEATWSAATHANFPAGAHFSALIGLAHRADGLVFRPGQLASLGIRNVAEIGNNTALRAEIAALRSQGGATGWLDGLRGAASPGTLTDTLRLDAAHPLATVVTMIAPSPDWFAALEGESLLGADGQWVARRDVPARAYDAGTDSGLTFTAPDQPTLPAEPISVLHLPPASGSGPDGPPVGTWHLERIR